MTNDITEESESEASSGSHLSDAGEASNDAERPTAVSPPARFGEPTATLSSAQESPQDSGPFDSPRVNIHAGMAATERPTTPGASSPSIPDAAEFTRGDLVESRYEILERLGSGGFGAVYSALDRDLNRTVAIKQSTRLRSFIAGRVREEARAVAALNHPNIVQIHDMVEVSAVEILIVMECLEGISLARRLQLSRLTIPEAVKVGVEIASALMHAHEKQLVHSDLKPGNLFVCKNGTIKLLDFGLAVAYFPDQAGTKIGGTPGYMSPEQIRGESHLIDGRTDIWAFGVVLFEMLTGSRPFLGENAAITNKHTLVKSAPPPRQLNPEVDSELERIVLKCLQPLLSGRYASAAEMREDLVQWLTANAESVSSLTGGTALAVKSEADSSDSARLGKRGLQPFTELDASAYLTLIPGPRDRNGVPDSIRFWKRWVESNDPNTEHPVGVLYGPSGAGKTSYIRAGLFKQLSPEICRVYVECRPGDLGGRLTKILEARLQSYDSGSSLRDLLCRLRSGSSRRYGFQKMLIVLDQFESWALNATHDERLLFAEALRQCDGIQIRALVVTRDDYWLAAKELLHWLDLPMQEGRNVASVDLLDPAHAERILESIGRESGSLPSDGEPLSSQQQQFVTQAVGELTVDGSIICVHLVMFAQMVRLQQWTPKGLRESGGVSGACGLFFQELFERSNQHSPEYRRIGPAVPHVLSKLVPAAKDNVADVFASRDELRSSVVDAGHAKLFDDCMRVLCEDLRIVAVVSADSPIAGESDEASVDQYRLAHDFLVEPINACLSRMASRSWRGRTKSRLVEMSEVWSRRQTRAHLPGFVEFLSLLPATAFQRHSETESKFIKAATRLHAGRISAALLFFLAFVVMSILAWNQWNRAKAADRRDLASNVSLLLKSEPSELPARIEALSAFGSEAASEVSVWKDLGDTQDKLRAELYLQSANPRTLKGIVASLEDAPPEFFETVLKIAKQVPDANTTLTTALTDANASKANRASILLAYLGDDADLQKRMAGSDDAFVDTQWTKDAVTWKGRPSLWASFISDTSLSGRIRHNAAMVLGSYLNTVLSSEQVALNFDQLASDDSPVVHSSALFLAKHFGQDVSDITVTPPVNGAWKLGPGGLSLIKLGPSNFTHVDPPIPGEARPRPHVDTEVDYRFWMSATPVSRAMYREFELASEKSDSEFDAAVSFGTYDVPPYLVSDATEPMLGTSLAQAYQFCNWLSAQDGLAPCYRPMEVEPIERSREKFTFQPIPWEYDAQANGYRVPTVDEYAVAARCGYQSGPIAEHALAIGRAANRYEEALRFSHKLFTFVPSRNGFFVFDRYQGSWICGDKRISAQAVYPRTIARELRIVAQRPLIAIFLAQNAID